jgi:hypothetical protein
MLFRGTYVNIVTLILTENHKLISDMFSYAVLKYRKGGRSTIMYIFANVMKDVLASWNFECNQHIIEKTGEFEN